MAYLTKVSSRWSNTLVANTHLSLLDMESSDKLNELFPNGTEFTLHRLLSDIGVNDMNIDMNDLVKFDPMKLLDARSFSEFVSVLPRLASDADRLFLL